MAIEFFDRRGNETDPNGNEIVRGLSSAPGNRASGYSVVYKKKPQAAAAPASPPASPPRPPKDPGNKKEPVKSDKKRPPEEGGLVRIRK
jgi:hypothetical protein